MTMAECLRHSLEKENVDFDLYFSEYLILLFSPERKKKKTGFQFFKLLNRYNEKCSYSSSLISRAALSQKEPTLIEHAFRATGDFTTLT